MSEPHVVILGGGPAGCGAAQQLRVKGRGRATLIEQQGVLGGNAGSFEWQGVRVDYGSHRLHAACDPEVLADIQRLLGDDLRHRDRHGRIRLRGKWLHFPLKVTDLLLNLDKRFALGVVRDIATGPLRPSVPASEDFAKVLTSALGPTITNVFYLPYGWKMWGQDPATLSGIQAKKRVSAGSVSGILKRLVKPPGAGKFYYPRRGYGQLSEIYADEAREHGAEILLESKAVELQPPSSESEPWKVVVEQQGSRRELEADYVWSTIPITVIARSVRPQPPAAVLRAVEQIHYRSMVLVYLRLDVDQFTTTDAHYFPERHIAMTRLSEPKNYFGLGTPKGTTVLCAELPCSREDDIWSMSDEELGKMVADDMAGAGLPLPVEPSAVMARRLPFAYPIYQQGYEKPLQVLDQWASELPRFLSYGRQGLFAHDNTHHALFMAYKAVDCLNGGFDRDLWAQYREIFKTHVVED